MNNFLLCSNCFYDEGLKIYSEKVGIENTNKCSNCNSNNGKKLNINLINHIVYTFFVKGTLNKTEYGAAPIIQFNDKRTCEIEFSGNLKKDVELLESKIKLGLFYYGPRLWMIGEVEPLKDLINERKRISIFERIVNEYPVNIINKNLKMYRLRVNPENINDINQYDSPPEYFLNTGRFDTKKLPILYASKDIDVCIHECRVSIEDNLYVATLETNKELKLLNLTEIIDENATEFESLDIAIHFLFFASKYSYNISRDLAQYIFDKGYDGIIYPSYFSLIRNGIEPFETVYGLSIRRIKELREYAKSQIAENIALFGYPIKNKLLNVRNINKLILNQIQYDYSFGPVNY